MFNLFKKEKDVSSIFKYLLKSPAFFTNLTPTDNLAQTTGSMKFYQTPYGIVVLTELKNLAKSQKLLQIKLTSKPTCEKISKEFFLPTFFPDMINTDDYALSAFLSSELDFKILSGKTIAILSAQENNKVIACGKIIKT